MGKCRNIGTAGMQEEICIAVLTHGVYSTYMIGKEQSICNALGMPFSASHLKNYIINAEITFCFSFLLANSHVCSSVLLLLLCIVSLTPQKKTKRERIKTNPTLKLSILLFSRENPGRSGKPIPCIILLSTYFQLVFQIFL